MPEMRPFNPRNIKANLLYLYYKDLAKVQKFYEETLGLKRVLDYGFVSIHQISQTSFVGLVDETRGSHKASEPKTVTLSFITEEVDGWYQYLREQGVGVHHPLGDASRHPTRGFVVYDPEGYFLEFETFLAHEQNSKLRTQLDQNKALHPEKGKNTTRPVELGIQGNVIWLYYKDLDVAQQFYTDVLDFKLLVDQGFAKVCGSSETGFIGLVDGSQGLHPFSKEKSVTVSFITDDVEDWFFHFKSKGIELHTPSISVEQNAVEKFLVSDMGGYFIEFDRFLDHELNRDILSLLKF